MTQKPSPVTDLHSSAIKYIVGGIAGLLLSAVTLFLRHFAKPTYDTFISIIPKDALIQVTSIFLLALLLAIVWISLLSRERKRPLADKYDFHDYGGYYIDRKNGRAICPQCLSEEKVVHMMDVGGNKKCNACDTVGRGKSK